MSKTKELFWTFFKIGAFTFGGGYAMVALLQNEFVEEKKWVTKEEFLDMVAIAESTPGPVAVNSATYIGYKIEGTAGAAASTVAVCLPSFAVIYLISLFFDQFLRLSVVASAFHGIQVCDLSDPFRRTENAEAAGTQRLQYCHPDHGCGSDGGLFHCSSVLLFHFLHPVQRCGRAAGVCSTAAAEGGEEAVIYVELFWNFLMIGALSFGGGYGMISRVRETVLGHGWLTETEFLSFIAVSESTPGPLAINMATFIGASQGGFWGALCATLGVVLPSFVIILLVASVLQNLMKYAGINAVLGGVRPCVVAMILATAVNMALSTLAGFAADKAGIAPDLRSIVVFLLLWALHLLCRKRNGKAPSPILMILISAGLGILFWGA